MRSRWSVGAMLAGVLACLEVTLAAAAGIVPPHHPASNVSPVPAYSIVNNKSYLVGGPLPPCWTWSRSGQLVPRAYAPTCVKDELAATNRAQSAEGLGPATLPRTFARLSAPEQLLVLVDIERVSRGEVPVVGVSARLNQFAQLGAANRQDPELPSPTDYPGATGGFTANWAGALSALDANYVWMYGDGWAGAQTDNYDCTSPSASGCWGHRDNILTNGSRLPCLVSTCALVMGGGFVNAGGGDGFSSYAELIVQVSGAPTGLYYTWARAVAQGAIP